MQTKRKLAANMMIAAVTAGITILYLSLLFNQNIWTDEAYTIQLVSGNNWIDMIRETAKDVHPPLYYLLVKCFVAIFGTEIPVYKAISVIPMVLTMGIAFFSIKPWFGNRAAVLYLLFLNAIPCVMEYGVQIRMYSWAMFFVTWAAFGAYAVYQKGDKKAWAGLTAASLCACYTHNFAMISVVFVYLILGVVLAVSERKQLKKWFISGSLIAVCYLPWLFVLYRQTTQRVGNYWIEEVTGSAVLGYFTDIFASEIPYTTLMFLILCAVSIFLLGIQACRKQREGVFALCIFLVPLLTAFAGIMVSILITPFFIARYLLPCMGLLAAFLAIGFSREAKAVQGILAVFLVLLLAQSYQTNYEKEYHSTHTRELLSYLEENMGDNDLIVYNYEKYGFIYQIYFDADRTIFLEDMDFGTEFDRIWYFDSCTTPWLATSVLEEYGLQKKYIASLGIEQNDFLLYEISRVPVT